MLTSTLQGPVGRFNPLPRNRINPVASSNQQPISVGSHNVIGPFLCQSLDGVSNQAILDQMAHLREFILVRNDNRMYGFRSDVLDGRADTFRYWLDNRLITETNWPRLISDTRKLSQNGRDIRRVKERVFLNIGERNLPVTFQFLPGKQDLGLAHRTTVSCPANGYLYYCAFDALHAKRVALL
ncbi:MAG: hypothetical protein BWY63_02841 [Chloroflexi bacterium ADurb.Bin360]|nr:MAG: hypothetical protein BWY63_02841 [Chloroflexi bacterium ADurb.Bin360]